MSFKKTSVLVFPKKEDNAQVALAVMNQAATLIDKAKKIDEILVAKTLLDFAQQQARRFNLDKMEKQVIDYRAIFKDKMGEAIADLKEKGELSQGGRPAEKTTSNLEEVSAPEKTTLADLHVTQKESAEFQRFHSLPDEQKKQEIEAEKKKVGVPRTRRKIIDSPQPPLIGTASGNLEPLEHVHIFNRCACGATEGISN